MKSILILLGVVLAFSLLVAAGAPQPRAAEAAVDAVTTGPVTVENGPVFGPKFDGNSMASFVVTDVPSGRRFLVVYNSNGHSTVVCPLDHTDVVRAEHP